jgi:hypothetical protein
MCGARTFRVIVSSTIADLFEERDALQQPACQDLTPHCEKQACRLQANDWPLRPRFIATKNQVRQTEGLPL